MRSVLSSARLMICFHSVGDAVANGLMPVFSCFMVDSPLFDVAEPPL